MRRTVTALTTCLLPVLMGALTVAGSIDARTVGTMSEHDGHTAETRDGYSQIAAGKARNVWTDAALADAGYDGCKNALTDNPTYTHPADAHIVRLPAAEGYKWVRMTREDVAERMAWAGGTETTADDVKIAGNCYPTTGR